MDYALYTASGELLGYHDESDLRPLISRQHARVVRKGRDVRVVMTREATHRVKALSTHTYGSALKSTYAEQLYSGSKKDGPVVVSKVMLTMKKALAKTREEWHRGGTLVPYTETEGFARLRWNPDMIRKPLYPTERAAMEALGK